MKTPKELIAQLDALIAAAQAAARTLALSPDDAGIDKAGELLGSLPWEIDRSMGDALDEVTDRKALAREKGSNYFAHYTFAKRRHYVLNADGSRRIFSYDERCAYDFPDAPKGAKHFDFTIVESGLASRRAKVTS